MSTAYLFPGQGSQAVGMGQVWYDTNASAKALFDEADDSLGFSFSYLCFNGPEDELTDTVNQQPALFVSSLAELAVIRENNWGDMPAFMAGHSLGELTALTAAGSLSFADGLRLVRKRGELMAMAGEQNPGGLVAILALSVPQLEEICAQAVAETGKPVQIANDNCPGQVVISGDNIALERAMTLATEAKAKKVVKLPITIAAHSTLMASAATAFNEAVENTPIQAPTIPVIGNTTAQLLTTPAEIRAELNTQLTGAVRWTETLQFMLGHGVDTFVEVGEGKVLLSLVKRVNRKSKRLKYKDN